MDITTDIDIDMVDRTKIINLLPAVQASIIKNNTITSHNSGIYLQNITVDPETGQSSLDYEKAEDYGYFKIDFLNNRVYEGIKSKKHLFELMHREPMWNLLLDKNVVKSLPHIHSEKYLELIEHIQPKSVEDLAIIVALIRPNKNHLWFKSRYTIDKEIWDASDKDSGDFKKGHALAVAYQIIIRLNIIIEHLHEIEQDKEELFG